MRAAEDRPSEMPYSSGSRLTARGGRKVRGRPITAEGAWPRGVARRRGAARSKSEASVPARGRQLHGGGRGPIAVPVRDAKAKRMIAQRADGPVRASGEQTLMDLSVPGHREITPDRSR